LGQVRSVASNFRAVAGQISDGLNALGGQISATVQQINSLTTRIAELNQAIAARTGASGGLSNSLLDQRDELVQQLGAQLGVTVLTGANGALDVYTSNGAVLVDDANSYQLAAVPSGYGDGEIRITYGPTGQDLTRGISGGVLGGLLTSRAQLVSTRDAVGALAAGFSAAVNTQQSLGLDPNGKLGGPLFLLAAPIARPSLSNTGSGSLTAEITDLNAFTPNDFIVTKTAEGFQATDTATGQVTALGGGPTLSLEGMTITVAGTVQNGDSFEIEPTSAAAQTITPAISDPSAIAAAAPYVVTAGHNAGNVTAQTGAPAAAADLPAGAVRIPAASFGQAISIHFTTSTHFDVLSSTNAVIASGTFDPTTGAEIAIAYQAPAPAGEFTTVSLSPGSAAAGDSFSLTPGGVGSNGNIVAMAGLGTRDVVSGQTLNSAYSALVSSVGSRGQEADATAQATQAVLSRAQQTEQSVSGVSLDEQAADLVNYQQAYQAAARVIATAQTLFQSLLSAV
jgi:flagellar hook-associated protein 1 FlgK